MTCDELAICISQRDTPIQAITFLKAFDTSTKPALITCTDGHTYVIKGPQTQRKAINDQIVARLGLAMKAPVGVPSLIDLPSELVALEPKLSHFTPGLSHGVRYLPDCIDEYDFIAIKTPQNRLRFSHLAVLYGWVKAFDIQFLYLKQPPQLVSSVDHSHFFPLNEDGEDWDELALSQEGTATIDKDFDICKFTRNELNNALEDLQAVSRTDIVQAVASPPDQWGITMSERYQLVKYLLQRQQDLLGLLTVMQTHVRGDENGESL